MKITHRALAFAVPAILVLAAGPAQAAAAPHGNSHQATTSHTVHQAGSYVWTYAATFSSESECEAVGLAEYESGEALDYLCSGTTTCPTEWQLYLEYYVADAVAAALPVRSSAVQPACG